MSEAVTSKAESGFYNDFCGQRIQAEDVEDYTGKTASSLGLISCFFEDKVSSRKVSSAASHVSHQGKTLGQDDYL